MTGNVFDDAVRIYSTNKYALGHKLKYWSSQRHYLITETLKEVQVIPTANISHVWAHIQVTVQMNLGENTFALV